MSKISTANSAKTEKDVFKSWKKKNEERKALKKQRKQEKLIKQFEQQQKCDELLGNVARTNEPKPEPSTVSLAVPGSILENAQSAELRTYLAGQVARALCIFRVNEVIVFDDVGIATAKQTKRHYEEDDGTQKQHTDANSTVRASSLQLARILQYLECPQYLRKFFFPLHKDLQYSGLLNPLDAPHHLRHHNAFLYREGIVSEKKAKEGKSYVNVGLLNDVLVDKAIAPGMRVTVKLQNVYDTSKKLRGTVVSPCEPRRETGVYWGYNVRIAHSLSEVFTKSPYDSGYDLIVGTSDRGNNVQELTNRSLSYSHLLVLFGGLKGLETALANDDKLNVDNPALLCDQYLNVLPKQGSRTIRTEEAMLIALAALQEKLNPKVPDAAVDLDEFLLSSEHTTLQQAVTDSSIKAKNLAQDKRQSASETDHEQESTPAAQKTKRPKTTKKATSSNNNLMQTNMDTNDLSRFD